MHVSRLFARLHEPMQQIGGCNMWAPIRDMMLWLTALRERNS